MQKKNPLNKFDHIGLTLVQERKHFCYFNCNDRFSFFMLCLVNQTNLGMQKKALKTRSVTVEKLTPVFTMKQCLIDPSISKMFTLTTVLQLQMQYR